MPPNSVSLLRGCCIPGFRSYCPIVSPVQKPLNANNPKPALRWGIPDFLLVTGRAWHSAATSDLTSTRFKRPRHAWLHCDIGIIRCYFKQPFILGILRHEVWNVLWKRLYRRKPFKQSPNIASLLCENPIQSVDQSAGGTQNIFWWRQSWVLTQSLPGIPPVQPRHCLCLTILTPLTSHKPTIFLQEQAC